LFAPLIDPVQIQIVSEMIFCDRQGVPNLRKLTSELLPFDTLNIFDDITEQIFVNRLLLLYILVTDYRRLATMGTSLHLTIHVNYQKELKIGKYSPCCVSVTLKIW
jgi:hypothetical protein